MKVNYDELADALYIRLTDHSVLRSQKINEHVALDLDEQGQVIGIEILSVRQSGIDPEMVKEVHSSTTESPDQELIRQKRADRMEALKRQHEKQTENN